LGEKKLHNLTSHTDDLPAHTSLAAKASFADAAELVKTDAPTEAMDINGFEQQRRLKWNTAP
jgi:hypothetical protein